MNTREDCQKKKSTNQRSNYRLNHSTISFVDVRELESPKLSS